MSSVLVINATGVETRVALVENGTISEFFLERQREKGIVGNIYLGRVVRVLPGMQAAFVDIGLDKAAFLYVSDVFYDPDFSDQVFDLTEGEHVDVADAPLPDNGEAVPSGDSGPVALPSPPGPTEAAAASPQGPNDSGPGSAPVAPTVPVPSSAPPSAAPPATQTGGEAAAAVPLAPNELGLPSDPATASPKGPNPVGPSSAPAAVSAAGPTSGPARAGEARGEHRRHRGRRSGRHGRGRDRGEDETPSDARHGDEVARPRKIANIQDLLKVGQEVLVQVAKDPIGTKGARLTSHISLPGRHLVFMPTVDHVGISRRISIDKERRRLREIVDRMRPPGTGFIVRTVADGVSQEKLEADIRFLLAIWNEIGRKKEKANGRASLLHPDLDLILRSTRDLFAQDIEKLVIDDRVEYERVCRFLDEQDPQHKNRVELYTHDEPVFDAYGIEQELNRATQRKVWLKSGGYIILDQAEALTAIDVNSGRYVGKKNLEETITRINIEAAKEIVYQLRLRNIGGIIIIDFIDMDKSENRDKVFNALHEALGRDRAKTNVLKISELGLVEMTRKRVRESVTRMINEPCRLCDGKGHVKTARAVAYEILRFIRRDAAVFKEPTLVANCHPDVAAVLTGEEREELRYVMDRYNKGIHVRAQPQYHREQYDINGKAAGRESKGPPSGEAAAVVDRGGPAPAK